MKKKISVFILSISIISNLLSKNLDKKKQEKKIDLNSISSLKKKIFQGQTDEKSLLSAKKFVDSLTKKNTKQEILYYKGIVYSLLSKKSLAIDSDGLEYLKIALNCFKKIINDNKANKQLLSFSKLHINELYDRYLERQAEYQKKNASSRVGDIYTICKLIDDKRPDTHLLIADNLFEKKEYKAAETQYKQYYKLGGRNPRYFYGISTILYIVNNQRTEAEKIIDEGILLHPFDSRIISLKFIMLENQNNLSSFLNFCNKLNFIQDGAKEYLYAKYFHKKEIKKKYFKYMKIAALKAKTQYQPQYELGSVYYNKAVDLLKKLKEVITKDKLDKTTRKSKIINRKKREKIEKKLQDKKAKLEKKIKKNMKNSRYHLRKAYYINPENKIILKNIKLINTYLLSYKKRKQKVDQEKMEEEKKKQKEEKQEKEYQNSLNPDAKNDENGGLS